MTSASNALRAGGKAPVTAGRLLSELRRLAPAIKSRAAEIEAARRLPLDLVATLRSIGIFRMFVPRSHGGLELDVPAAIEIVETLARIDGSVGWTATVGAANAMAAPLMPREIFERIYADGPDVIFAGSFMIPGKAEREAAGWRVNGRWPFASGCQHADWICGMCIVSDGGKPLPGPAGEGGPPMTRIVALPARDWQIEDTWHVMGLKGTGSHHVALKDTVVPATNFFDLANGKPCLPGPLYGSVMHFIPLMHATVALGIAQGALDEIVELANTGRQQTRAVAPMRETETFQGELGRIAAEVKAARSSLQVQVASHWRHALAGTLKTDALQMESIQTATWVTIACVHAVEACFALGGAVALYETSPLQRRVRDLQALGQHTVMQRRNYVNGGKLLLDRALAEARAAGEPAS
jgi:alkylation response protein AidB-like acyl-CoA dehydrogenase